MNQSSVYKIGLSERDVTPPVGILTAGFAALREKPSTSIELNLKTVVTYIEDEAGQPFLLVSIEWLGFYDKAPYVREKISAATGLAPHQIALNGTHTHAGPRIRERDSDILGPIDREYFEKAVNQMVDATREAIDTAVDSTIEVYTSDFELAINRRRIDEHGIAQWAPSPDGPVDKTLYALAIRNASDRQLNGLIFSYACHPTSRQTLDIGGDYVGFAYKHLRDRLPGVKTGFIQGFAGDIKPNFTTADGKNFQQVGSDKIESVGIRLADALTDMLQRKPDLSLSGPLCACSLSVPLRLERPTAELHSTFQQSTLEVSRKWAASFPNREQDSSLPPPVPFEIQLLRFGSSAALVFLAGEISVGYTAAIKNKFTQNFQLIIPVGYSNEMIGYVATSSQIPEGGYEVWYAHQHHGYPGFFTETVEPDILAGIEKLLTADCR